MCSSQETVLWQCFIDKGGFRREGAPRNDHTMNRLSYSLVIINFAWLWWSPMTSEALSYGLKLKKFALGSMPPDLPRTVCVTKKTNKKTVCAARAAWPHHPQLYVCPPAPLLQSVDPPLFSLRDFNLTVLLPASMKSREYAAHWGRREQVSMVSIP